ncbi:Superoxide dismutase [Mn], mitochondrial [Pichia californica]|uniref:Superoxide dismutase n=1 Tax=Pichia californica TaxID=460514 RepID=A0A9P6WMU8_9ASCO|nr:Superoxide dismutase [Mn], mitochondrial [[Candida] californica]KAG0689831.1 Superoxide dismutase [Mn], mitochondrial [[Candida] californica]
MFSSARSIVKKVNSPFIMSLVRNKVTLPELKYKFTELEPFISADLNTLHYTKHHQTYVNGINQALEQHAAAEAAGDLNKCVELQQNIKFHGGGYANHCLYWESLAPQSVGGGKLPAEDSALYKAVISQYGSFEKLIDLSNKALAGIQGSGWVFICKNLNNGALEIISVYNHERPAAHLKPLLALDAWEHAYYLQYQNVKVNFFSAIWNIINWEEAAKKFAA